MDTLVTKLAQMIQIYAPRCDVPLYQMRAAADLISHIARRATYSDIADGILTLAFIPDKHRSPVLQAYLVEVAQFALDELTLRRAATTSFDVLSRAGMDAFNLDPARCILLRAVMGSDISGQLAPNEVRQAIDAICLEGTTSLMSEAIRHNNPLRLITPRGTALIDQCHLIDTGNLIFRIGFEPSAKDTPALTFGEDHYETLLEAKTALKALVTGKPVAA